MAMAVLYHHKQCIYTIGVVYLITVILIWQFVELCTSLRTTYRIVQTGEFLYEMMNWIS